MNLQEFNTAFPSGSDVIYIDDFGGEHKTKTRSVAWALGSGDIVVLLEGRTGGYDIERIKVIPPEAEYKSANLVIFFDTETTGLPDWKSPSEAEHQPHIVQLAAHVVNLDTKEILESMNVIVKPEGWVIPQETIEIHGITNERAIAEGISEKDAILNFLRMWDGRIRIAFNTTFDNRIIRIATKRYCDESIIDQWHEGEYECAMMLARKILGGKNPTLTDAYEHFTGNLLKGAHSALADTNACMEVYFAAKAELAQAA